ncbi:MAG: hypothetical protein R3F61_18925 [Myxococcota bacterium]
MLSGQVRRIALAQVERGRDLASAPPPGLRGLVERAKSPVEIHHALLKEAPLLDARQRGENRPSPHRLREEAAAVGLIDATPTEVAYRRLFPTLDHGIYCAHHAVGVPSEALQYRMEEHHGQLYQHGLGAWGTGGWHTLMGSFRNRVCTVLAAAPDAGDVVPFPSVPDALAAVLDGGISGHLLCGADHTGSARSLHAWWSARTDSTFTALAGDRDGWVPTAQYVDALTPHTTVVSLRTAHGRTGRLHDLPSLAAAMRSVCPEATLLVDTGPSLGTIPFSVSGLPDRTAVLGGGLEQLHCGPGAGFAWLSSALLDDLRSLRAGPPDPAPLAALVTELDVLSTLGGGSIPAAIEQVRARTVRTVEAALQAARGAGLEVVGEEPARARVPLVCLRVPHATALVARLATEGVVADARAEGAGPGGLLRLSTAGAAFEYELMFAIERVATAMRGA